MPPDRPSRNKRRFIRSDRILRSDNKENVAPKEDRRDTSSASGSAAGLGATNSSFRAHTRIPPAPAGFGLYPSVPRVPMSRVSEHGPHSIKGMHVSVPHPSSATHTTPATIAPNSTAAPTHPEVTSIPEETATPRLNSHAVSHTHTRTRPINVLEDDPDVMPQGASDKGESTTDEAANRTDDAATHTGGIDTHTDNVMQVPPTSLQG